jgi:hypothetical protein
LFGKSSTQVRICFVSNKRSFGYHANTPSFMCGPRASVWLLVCLTTPTFRLSLAHFLITLHTYFGFPHPIVTHLS